MLKQRIITAVLLAPIVISIIIWANELFFLLLVSVLQLASSFEWLKMNGLKSKPALILAVFVSSLMVAVILLTEFQLAITFWMVFYLVIWLTALWWLNNHQIGYQNKPHQIWIKSTLGVFAIAIFALALNHVHQLQQGNWWTLVLFLLIWIADIGAYISGKTFGKRKLSPNISPGKTWEGVIGALVFVLLYATVVNLYMPIPLNIALTGFALIALFSVIGDLSASLAKRQAGLKDSSNLLPGHGGFIDRFDSLIAAAPIFSALLAYAI